MSQRERATPGPIQALRLLKWLPHCESASLGKGRTRPQEGTPCRATTAFEMHNESVRRTLHTQHVVRSCLPLFMSGRVLSKVKVNKRGMRRHMMRLCAIRPCLLHFTSDGAPCSFLPRHRRYKSMIRLRDMEKAAVVHTRKKQVSYSEAEPS